MLGKGCDTVAVSLDRELSDEQAFLQRALVLGCSDEEAKLWTRLASKRSWRFATSRNEFDRSVLDYLVEMSSGESWPRDLEPQLEN
jgi:hypothetical protein